MMIVYQVLKIEFIHYKGEKCINQTSKQKGEKTV